LSEDLQSLGEVRYVVEDGGLLHKVIRRSMANGPFCDCRIHIHVVYSFPSWCEHTHLGSIFVLVRSCDYRIHSVHARSLAMKIAIFLSNRCAPDGIVSTSRFSSH
jgi:hypothetical protein